MTSRQRPAGPHQGEGAADDASGMRDTSLEPERSGFLCAGCGRFIATAVAGLFARRRAGSPQRFCDHACRQAAYRRRCAGVDEDTPLQLAGGRNRRLAPAARPAQPEQPIPKPDPPSKEEAV